VEAESAGGGRERRQRERAPTEGDSIGEGRECWRRSGVRDSERERVDELSVGDRALCTCRSMSCVFSPFRSRASTVLRKPSGISILKPSINSIDGFKITVRNF
jgi:hypothetical protein